MLLNLQICIMVVTSCSKVFSTLLIPFELDEHLFWRQESVQPGMNKDSKEATDDAPIPLYSD